MLTLLAIALGALTADSDDLKVTIKEDDKPVFVYRLQPDPDLKAPESLRRACYIHPLYGLDGEVLTQDMPIDHLHHRGVFWAWPECLWGEQPLDIWLMKGVRTRSQEWSSSMMGGPLTLDVENVWSYDDRPDYHVIKEEGRIVVYPADGDTRSIDFDYNFTNVSNDPLKLLGAEDKGYGGFSIRPDAKHKPFTFYGAGGIYEEDQLTLKTPWTALSAEFQKGKTSGIAVLQHPGNPGYPHDGWILRHYGFLGASWPHLEPYTIAPGETLNLRYRMIVFRGTPDTAGIAKLNEEFVKEMAP